MTEDCEAAKQNNYRFVVLHGAFRRGRVIIILRTREQRERESEKKKGREQIIDTLRAAAEEWSVTINCAIVFSPMNRDQFCRSRPPIAHHSFARSRAFMGVIDIINSGSGFHYARSENFVSRERFQPRDNRDKSRSQSERKTHAAFSCVQIFGNWPSLASYNERREIPDNNKVMRLY